MSSVKRVPTRYFVTLVDALQAQGTDTAQLLSMAGIDDTQFRRADASLLPAQIEALIAAARRLTGRTDLGFEAGTLIKMTSHDILGYGMIGCRDFDQVLRLASRDNHVMNELFTLRYRRTPQLGEALYSPVAALPLETLRFMLEALALAHHNQMRLLLGSVREPYDMVPGMPRPPHHARYDSLLPARVRFDEQAMPGVRVLMGSALLDRPLPLASQAVGQQVSERLGFSDAANFSRAFRRCTGTTPARYQQAAG